MIKILLNAIRKTKRNIKIAAISNIKNLKPNKNKKVAVLITGGTIMLSALAFLVLSVSKESLNVSQLPFSALADYPKIIQSASISSASLKDIPAADMKSYPVNNAVGTAILIPQMHRSPGTNAQDSINDSGERAQKEIYDIISALHNKYNVKFIMAEGDLFGPVPSDKIDALSKKIDARNKFASQLENFQNFVEKHNLANSVTNNFLTRAKNVIGQVDRDINLAGAPYKLVAEGKDKDLLLYGAEDKDTLENDTIIIRNYIYQQDRMNQLTSPQGTMPAVLGTGAGINPQIQQMLQLMLGKSSSSLTSDFNSLKNLADSQNNTELSSLVNDISQSYADLQKSEQVAQTPASGPSRNDNPYESINDVRQLQTIMKETENQIQENVIDKRNQEAAANFAKALGDQDLGVGILQFGAGHEQGMVKELNDQGLNVIVFKPQEVISRSQQENLSDTSSDATKGVAGTNSHVQNPLMPGIKSGMPSVNPLMQPSGSSPTLGMLKQLLGNRGVRGQH